MKVGDKTVFDLETIFHCLLMFGQKRQLQLAPIFQYELCTILLWLIDEYGCIQKNKRELSPVLSLFNLSPNVTMDSQDDGAFTHDEADATTIASMLQHLVWM